MKHQLIDTLRQHFTSSLNKHRMNVLIMIDNPTAIPEHTDWMAAIESEIAQIAEYQDKLEVIDKYFDKGLV